MGATAADSLIDNTTAAENFIDNATTAESLIVNAATTEKKKEPNYKSIFDCSFESKPFYTIVWYFIRIYLGISFIITK